MYCKNGYKCHDYLRPQDATNLVSQVIAKRKEDYHNVIVPKLNEAKASAKTYWSIFRIFYNGKKIPVIYSSAVNKH